MLVLQGSPALRSFHNPAFSATKFIQACGIPKADAEAFEGVSLTPIQK